MCKCSKKGCLTGYCVCLLQGNMCSDKCECANCKNKSESIERTQILNKLTKIIKCNCKNTNCDKNYCKCYLNNIKCTILCNCCDECNNKLNDDSLKRKHNLQKSVQKKRTKRCKGLSEDKPLLDNLQPNYFSTNYFSTNYLIKRDLTFGQYLTIYPS